MDIEKLQKEKSHLIDREIESVFPKNSGIANLYEAVWYHLSTGGKRIRPLLAIMTYEALGHKDAKILPFAAACEVMHSWIILHDDIEDGDRVRRDMPAVWVRYGLAHGVNVGDLMAQKVFELILKSRDYGVDNEKIFELAEAMTATAVKTAEGQAMDINLRGSGNPTEKDYLEMVTGKTTHYMTVPMVGAAILAGRKDLVQNLVRFGSFIGPAFQITDDILDLAEGKGRGEICSDIKEGKRNMLVVHCLSRCTKEEREKLLSILDKQREETTEEDVKFAKSLFEKYHSIEYAKKKAEDFAAEAKEVANSMPQELRSVLNFFADYLVKRKK